MDPLVLMDYADDMNPFIMLLGIVMFFSAFAVQAQMLSNLIGMDYTIIDSLIFMLYGISTFIGGFIQGEAEYLEYFIDISAAVGYILFFGGSFAQTLVSEGLWFKTSIVALLFLSIPSTFAVWYARESVYEEGKFGPRHRFD
ncbi:MAG: hypothetical protein ABEJ87_02725 [Candidatus Nanohalobium sp.]